MWNWFLKNGDKFLAWATATAAAGQAAGLYTGKAAMWVTFGLAAATSLHNTFLPEASSVPKAP